MRVTPRLRRRYGGHHCRRRRCRWHGRRLETAVALLSGWGSVEVTDNIWGYTAGNLGYASMAFGVALTDEAMADIIDPGTAR